MAEDQAPATAEFGPVSVQIVPTQSARYANNVVLTRTQHELFLVQPPIGGEFTAEHITRIALPLTVMRGLLGAITEQTEGYERDFGMPLPDTRTQSPRGGT